MSHFLQRGKEAEELAARYLKSQGYQVREKNFRNRLGEIDLIVFKADHLHFVEVKGRWTQEMGSPLDQITPRKMRQISKVAQSYLQRFPLGESQRVYLSVIGVDKSSNAEKIQWVPDAFDVVGGW